MIEHLRGMVQEISSIHPAAYIIFIATVVALWSWHKRSTQEEDDSDED